MSVPFLHWISMIPDVRKTAQVAVLILIVGKNIVSHRLERLRLAKISLTRYAIPTAAVTWFGDPSSSWTPALVRQIIIASRKLPAAVSALATSRSSSNDSLSMFSAQQPRMIMVFG